MGTVASHRVGAAYTKITGQDLGTGLCLHNC